MIQSMKHLIFSILTLLFISSAFAQQTEESQARTDAQSESSPSSEAFSYIPELECEESTDIDERRTKVTFTANVKNALIYLNGNLHGRTKLTLSNLTDGIYLLRVTKEDYLTQEYFITADHGKAKTYYVELQQTEETQKKLDSQAQKQSAQASKAEAPAESTAQDTAAEPAQADAAATEGTSSGAIQ